MELGGTVTIDDLLAVTVLAIRTASKLLGQRTTLHSRPITLLLRRLLLLHWFNLVLHERVLRIPHSSTLIQTLPWYHGSTTC